MIYLILWFWKAILSFILQGAEVFWFSTAFFIHFVLTIGTILLMCQHPAQGFKPYKIWSIYIAVVAFLFVFYHGMWLDIIWYLCSDAVFSISGNIWILLMFAYGKQSVVQTHEILYLWYDTPCLQVYVWGQVPNRKKINLWVIEPAWHEYCNT